MRTLNGKIRTSRSGAINTAPALTLSTFREVNMAKESLPEYFFNSNNLEFPPKPTNPLFKDIDGQVFGKWTVLGYAGRSSLMTHWWCQCTCGRIKRVQATALRNGGAKQCRFCFPRPIKHGLSASRTYTHWHSMISRCCYEKGFAFKHYGGRGITVCDRWRQDFAAFLQDMGDPPSPKHSLDRIDVNGNYEPGNCRWALPVEQANNKRTNHRVTLNNETHTMTEWSRIVGMAVGTISSRLKRGWCAACVLTPGRLATISCPHIPDGDPERAKILKLDFEYAEKHRERRRTYDKERYRRERASGIKRQTNKADRREYQRNYRAKRKAGER
jgi:hypothetical protein